MRLLERYILRENIRPFVISLVVVTFVMLLDKIIELLEIIIDKRLDFVMIVSIFGYSLPFILALTVPMAVLLATIMAFGRMSVDNEITAFKSCGINIIRMIKPVFLAAILLSGFMIYFNNEILPETNHRLKNLMIQANYRRPITAITPGMFNTTKNYTIYARERHEDELRGIVIYNRKDSTFPQTISAERGHIVLSDGGNSLLLTLYNGQLHERDSQDPDKYQVTNFDKYSLIQPDLGYQLNPEGTEHRSDRELSSRAMMAIIEEKRMEKQELETEKQQILTTIERLENKETLSQSERNELRRNRNLYSIRQDKIESVERSIRRYQVEIHKKYAIAIACLIFILIGVPIGMMTRSSGVGMAFTVSAVVFLIYYGALTLGEELADNAVVSPFMAMWFANIVFGVIGVYLIIHSMKEMTFIDFRKYWEKIKYRIGKK